MATVYAQAMQQIVRDTMPLLKAAGFRKRRHGFNRRVEAGMVHVVSFQMGPYEPPGTEEIPPFRIDLYGRFAVNLGIYVAEMVLEDWQVPKEWVNEAQCQLRKRLGELVTDGASDLWWFLDEPSAASSDVADALSEFGLPWLDRFLTRADLLREWRSKGPLALGMSPRGPIEIAWMLADSDRQAAESLIRTYLAEDLAPGHREWLAKILPTRGFGHLVT